MCQFIIIRFYVWKCEKSSIYMIYIEYFPTKFNNLCMHFFLTIDVEEIIINLYIKQCQIQHKVYTF